MTPEDVNRAYEAASNLDFLIRTLQFTAATNEPDTQSCFDAGLDAITAAFDEFNELIAPILPHFQSSAPARYGFDMHPSMHVAILNCADHLRRKPTHPDSYNDATDGFIHSVATLELPRRDEMEAALWNEKQSTTVVVSLQSQVSPQSRSVTKNGPLEKGGTHDRSDSISTNRGDLGSQGTDKSGKVSTPKIPSRRFWNDASSDDKEDPFDEKYLRILRVLRDKRCTSNEARMPLDNIAKQIDPHNNKTLVQKQSPWLAKNGYIDTLACRPKKGHSGGCFITPKGLAHLQKSEKKREG